MMSNSHSGKADRLAFIDIAKGIGILSMILGHIEGGYLTRMVYSFHMPLFFIISGYLLSDKTGVRDYAKKKTVQMFRPYALTCAFLFAFEWLRALPNGGLSSSSMIRLLVSYGYGAGSSRLALPEGVNLAGAIWFLPALLFAQLTVRLALQSKLPALVVACVSIASYCTSKVLWLPLSIQAGGFASMYVYIGYMAKQYRKSHESSKRIEGALCLAALALWLLAMVVPGLYVVLAANYSDHLLPSIVISIVISFAVLIVSADLTGARSACSLMSFFGRNSLAVLCVHVCENRFIPWDSVGQALHAANPFYRILPIFFMKIILIAACIRMLSAIPFFQKTLCIAQKH